MPTQSPKTACSMVTLSPQSYQLVCSRHLTLVGPNSLNCGRELTQISEKWGVVWSCKLKGWCGHFFSCQQEIKEKQKWDTCNLINVQKEYKAISSWFFSFHFAKWTVLKWESKTENINYSFTKWDGKEKTLFKQWALTLNEHSEHMSGKKWISGSRFPSAPCSIYGCTEWKSTV